MAKEIGDIPAAPGINVETLIKFDDDCIDPLARLIVTEALQYAIETSARRLESIGKIFGDVEESAYRGGSGILPVVKAVYNAFLDAPVCTADGPKVMPRPVEPTPVPFGSLTKKPEGLTEKKKKKAETKTEKKAVTPEAIAATKSTAELKTLLEGHPELLEAAKKAQTKDKAVEGQYQTFAEVASEMKTPSGKERKPPTLWGKVYLHTTEKNLITGQEVAPGEFESPAALAEALGIAVEPRAQSQVILFERAGFSVKGNGGNTKPFKTEEGVGFHVRRIKPTERKWRAIPVTAEFAGGGRSLLPQVAIKGPEDE